MKNFINKLGLLAKLYLFRSNLRTDTYNENTYNWSQGYKSGFCDAIDIVKEYDE